MKRNATRLVVESVTPSLAARFVMLARLRWPLATPEALALLAALAGHTEVSDTERALGVSRGHAKNLRTAVFVALGVPDLTAAIIAAWPLYRSCHTVPQRVEWNHSELV